MAKANDDPAVDFVVLDAAVMLEAGWNNVCDRLVYVHAPRAQRLRRLAEQRGWTAKEVAARESAQLALTDKVSRADFAVDNSGPPEATGRQIEELLRQVGNPPSTRQPENPIIPGTITGNLLESATSLETRYVN